MIKKDVYFVGKALLVLLLVIAIRLITPEHRVRRNTYHIYRKDTLVFSILPDRKSRQGGFNRELIERFAEYNGSESLIVPPVGGEMDWEYLVDGKYDMLVFSLNDSIPEQYVSNVFVTRETGGKDACAVKVSDIKLLNSFNFWLSDFKSDDTYKQMVFRFFRAYRLSAMPEGFDHKNAISPYDYIIKKYSKYINADWRLISAIIYEESRFIHSSSSSKNARGLMQIKESTAAIYGVDNILDPELNIKAGTLHFDYLFNLYRQEGLDSANVIKFALASYNAGAGRIQQCREHAASVGLNPNDWEEVVKGFDSMPDFKGTQTTRYVRNVIDLFERYKQVVD
ncbi:MAG: transglycosylase SLT domain-containing protein [Bacteroidales bacterium]|jgi:soluble lytic murein transglycosylase-like protein|nr:transglycosylase SLT domain-containing protein [Bacteroidales bacterium]